MSLDNLSSRSSSPSGSERGGEGGARRKQGEDWETQRLRKLYNLIKQPPRNGVAPACDAALGVGTSSSTSTAHPLRAPPGLLRDASSSSTTAPSSSEYIRKGAPGTEQQLSSDSYPGTSLESSMDNMVCIPLDENGELTSVGSMKHAEGKCKPCLYNYNGTPCAAGVSCRFCHFPHKTLGRVRLRPCKGRREKVKKALDRIQKDVKDDPDNFDLLNLELPGTIANTPYLKDKLISRLSAYAEEVRDKQSGAPAREMTSLSL
mmetsp:Transcript_22405/g.76773  ORF Transcript_22405/g.76773 Transcript_22405/m.76773 type:complete len:261 (-) Transcript_22405:146-928(-)